MTYEEFDGLIATAGSFLEAMRVLHERAKTAEADFRNAADVGRRLEADLETVMRERDEANAEILKWREQNKRDLEAINAAQNQVTVTARERDEMEVKLKALASHADGLQRGIDSAHRERARMVTMVDDARGAAGSWEMSAKDFETKLANAKSQWNEWSDRAVREARERKEWQERAELAESVIQQLLEVVKP